MINPQELFSTIHEQVSQIFPEATKTAHDELMSNLKIMVTGIIGKLDLVSREEFDAQQLVLERTREKLDALEREMSDLEQRLSSTNESSV